MRRRILALTILTLAAAIALADHHQPASPLRQLDFMAVGDGLFLGGQNCLRVEVQDFGFFTGLNLVGTVNAPEGECEP